MFFFFFCSVYQQSVAHKAVPSGRRVQGSRLPPRKSRTKRITMAARSHYIVAGKCRIKKGARGAVVVGSLDGLLLFIEYYDSIYTYECVLSSNKITTFNVLHEKEW